MRAAAQPLESATVADGGKSESCLLCSEAHDVETFRQQMAWLEQETIRLRQSRNRAALHEVRLRLRQLDREIGRWELRYS